MNLRSDLNFYSSKVKGEGGESARARPACLGRGAVGRGLLRRWAQWPSAPVPAVSDRAPRPARGRRRGFHQPTSKSMAVIPSSGSLVATHDYYRRRLVSTSSNSSCGSAEYPGEGIPRHPGLPRADPGRWWASFFFGKSTLPFMATVLGSPEQTSPGLHRHDHL